MGKYRSKSGCLTCRHRRVKCDETKPICGNCGKKNRDCQWESQQTKFRGYQPDTGSSSATVQTEAERMDVQEDYEDGEDMALSPSRHRGKWEFNTASHDPSGRATAGLQQPSASPFFSQVSSPASIQAGGGVAVPVTFSTALPTKESTPIARLDAKLIHHYTEHLGRWLDGTDPGRQFTLRVPEQVSHCPILLHAVGCFAARHSRDDAIAEEAYQACLALVIERLNLNTALHDDDLLCAIVILRFFEQLNVPVGSSADDEQHLSGTSAILRSSQTTSVDPSAPTLREAAFWVYVRQCLYRATINQQPPNLDFTLELNPLPSYLQDHYPLATLRVETGWANQMTWYCARATNLCFDRDSTVEPSLKMKHWQGLWDEVESWRTNRPRSFDPIWSGHSDGNSIFPEIYFIADWHIVAFGFYHFCCILLLVYKPGPRFAIRTVGQKQSDRDQRILEHVRAICGSCESSPECITSLITFCHTIFVWAPLLFDERERKGVLEILATLESNERWPTKWIINELKTEWEIE